MWQHFNGSYFVTGGIRGEKLWGEKKINKKNTQTDSNHVKKKKHSNNKEEEE